jgi:phospholipase C
MVHLGNYSLWLAGLFPQYIEARRLRYGGPDMSYYDGLGRRGYAMASDHVLADHFHLEAVLHTAAERYPTLREGLNTLSERILFPGGYTQ